ncbi:hypothetical protein FB451DRAFT_1243213 [Mycena latifolia]|nr:hypothetical protein FB451DRAFT_1243213 [Mycena latifolia]
MSSENQPFNVHSTTIYRYAVVGALAAVALIGGALFFRSRFEERLRGVQEPTLVGTSRGGQKERPLLFDAYLVYLGSSGGALTDYGWHEIMPLSLQHLSSRPQNPTKNVPSDKDPPLSGPSTVITIIAMPHPSSPPSTSAEVIARPEHSKTSLENDDSLPHVEIGVVDVEVRTETREGTNPG